METYVVVTPARNEEAHLEATIASMRDQTVCPTRWVIVNDGSTDRTGEIAMRAANDYPWISVIHRKDRGFRKAGGGVVESFYDGYRMVESEDWDYLVKLDGDLSFQTNYFEWFFEQFRSKPQLGIAGGTISSQAGEQIEAESKTDPRFHVRGATKIYRRQCWADIGGLIAAPGWDTFDEVKANMNGWSTRTFSEMPILHHRPAGAAYGAWNDWVKGGLANYIVGYHPLFMAAKCLRRMLQRPYGLGGCALLYGFCKGYLQGIPQVEDRAVIQYFRKQQVNRLLFRPSLWDY